MKMKISAWRIHWYGIGLYLLISGFNAMDWGDPLLRYGSGWPAHVAGLIWCIVGTWICLGGALLMMQTGKGHMD